MIAAGLPPGGGARGDRSNLGMKKNAPVRIGRAMAVRPYRRLDNEELQLAEL